MVSSGGGDPPCICSGFVSSRAIEGCATPRFWGGLRLVAAGRRFAAGRVFALVWRVPVVRRLKVARRFAVFRCFEVVRRFTGFRFFRDEREVAARTDCAGGLSFRSVVFHFAAQLSDHCSCWSGQALASYPNTSADPQTLVKHYCFWQSS